jgi:hypothetical protein
MLPRPPRGRVHHTGLGAHSGEQELIAHEAEGIIQGRHGRSADLESAKAGDGNVGARDNRPAVMAPDDVSQGMLEGRSCPPWGRNAMVCRGVA